MVFRSHPPCPPARAPATAAEADAPRDADSSAPPPTVHVLPEVHVDGQRIFSADELLQPYLLPILRNPLHYGPPTGAALAQRAPNHPPPNAPNALRRHPEPSNGLKENYRN